MLESVRLYVRTTIQRLVDVSMIHCHRHNSTSQVFLWKQVIQWHHSHISSRLALPKVVTMTRRGRHAGI